MIITLNVIVTTALVSGISYFKPIFLLTKSHADGIPVGLTVYAFGDNTYGELGNGTTTNSTTPVQVSNLSGIISQIAAGNSFSLALKTDGTVWSWGLNGKG